jgi:hypothetical protein
MLPRSIAEAKAGETYMSLTPVISGTWAVDREICGKCPFRHHPKIDLAGLAAYRKPKRRSGQSSWAVNLFEISLLAVFVGAEPATPAPGSGLGNP